MDPSMTVIIQRLNFMFFANFMSPGIVMDPASKWGYLHFLRLEFFLWGKLLTLSDMMAFQSSNFASDRGLTRFVRWPEMSTGAIKFSEHPPANVARRSTANSQNSDQAALTGQELQKKCFKLFH